MTDEQFKEILLAKHSEYLLKKLDRSWVILEKKTRERRLESIIQLSIELGKIRELDQFATGWGSAVIEALIEGDLKAVLSWADMMNFANESPELMARYQPIWAKFRSMAWAAALPDEAFQ